LRVGANSRYGKIRTDEKLRSRLAWQPRGGSLNSGLTSSHPAMGAQHVSTEVSQYVNAHFQGRSNLKLLEAGCGSASHFDFTGVAKSVGIDISQDQLDKNTVLQEKILGDLQNYPLANNEFDIVVCWDVVEHLPEPNEAFRNMMRTVKQNGILILGFPHILSFKGLVTKFTPYWFHVLFYRVMKYRSTPCPTHMRLEILPKRVAKLAQSNGFDILFSDLKEGTVTKKVREKLRIIDRIRLRLLRPEAAASPCFSIAAFSYSKNRRSDWTHSVSIHVKARG
jgi:SAM-dependent methyltransferase